MSQTGGQLWGVIPSKRGLVDPYRTNLQNFAADVKAAGFKWEIAFGPQWSNSPISDNYKPVLLDENWRFIVEVRTAVVGYGPVGTKFDLMNEGAASIYHPSFNILMAYDREIWSRYVQKFGSSDATISAIVDDGPGRLQNLVSTLNGLPLPTWFEAHTYGDTVDDDLAIADLVLGGVGLRQPMTLGETFYEDAKAATQITTYVGSTTRPLPAIMEWPLMRSSACSAMSERPAYTANQYLTVR